MAPPAERPPSSREAFAQAVELLRSDRSRGFNIDVETDTMVFEDQRFERQSRVEFITAVSQFMQQAVPAAQLYPEMRPLLIRMLMFGVRGFKAGRDLEQAFEQAEDQFSEAGQAQPKPDPKAEEAKAKIAADKERLATDREDKGIRRQEEFRDATIRREADLAHEQRKQAMAEEAEMRKIAMQEAAEMRKAQAQPVAATPDPNSMVSEREKFEQERLKADREYKLKLAAQNKQVISDEETDFGGGATVQPSVQIVEAITNLASAIGEANRQLASQIAEGQQRASQDAQAIAQGLEAIIAHQAAPVSISRDKRGKAVSISKGDVTMEVVNGPDGRPVGLQ